MSGYYHRPDPWFTIKVMLLPPTQMAIFNEEQTLNLIATVDSKMLTLLRGRQWAYFRAYLDNDHQLAIGDRVYGW